METVNEATCDMILHRILDAADSVKAQIDLSNVRARAAPRLPLLDLAALEVAMAHCTVCTWLRLAPTHRSAQMHARTLACVDASAVFGKLALHV